jgi:hypothetical protein
VLELRRYSTAAPQEADDDLGWSLLLLAPLQSIAGTGSPENCTGVATAMKLGMMGGVQVPGSGSRWSPGAVADLHGEEGGASRLACQMASIQRARPSLRSPRSR